MLLQLSQLSQWLANAFANNCLGNCCYKRVYIIVPGWQKVRAFLHIKKKVFSDLSPTTPLSPIALLTCIVVTQGFSMLSMLLYVEALKTFNSSCPLLLCHNYEQYAPSRLVFFSIASVLTALSDFVVCTLSRLRCFITVPCPSSWLCK